MKINLRKASQLERDVQTLISDLQDQLEGRIELDEFSKPLDEIERALFTFNKLMTEITQLRDVIFHIRKAVATTNAQVGITDLLAEKAKLEQNIKMLSRYTKNYPVLGDMQKLHRRVEAMMKSEDSYKDTIMTSIVSEAMKFQLQEDVKNFKRDLRRIDSDLLECNIKNYIELVLILLFPGSLFLLHVYGAFDAACYLAGGLRQRQGSCHGRIWWLFALC